MTVGNRLIDVACNLCGSRSYAVKFRSEPPSRGPAETDFKATTDRYGYFGQVVRCRDCGLVFTNPRLRDDDLIGLYQESDDEEYQQEDAARSINAFFSLNTITRFVRTGRLVDIGCSTGYFLNAARLDFEVVGLEPSAAAARFAREKLQLDVRQTSLEKAGLESGSFSIATMLDVIEHVPDPLGTIREVNRILEPGGYVYLVTPDVSGWAARLLGMRWWGLRPAHIYYFSTKTLSAILRKAGFEVVFHRSYGRVFTGQYWASRLKGYSAGVTGTVSRVIRKFNFSNKLVYINTFDSLEICARKL